MPHVAIIGAGPAGSVAALLLLRRGFQVTLIEQHRFPRDKVCGECLGPSGIDVLDRLGLSPFLERFKPSLLIRALLQPSSAEPVEVSLPRPMWGLSRLVMDAFLLEKAVEGGARIHQPARCETVIPGEPPTLLWRCLATNQLREERPDWVVIADGKGALPDANAPNTRDLGMKAHFIDIDGPRDAIELFGVNGHYGGLAAIEAGQWNTAFSVPVARMRANGPDLDRLFRQMIGENRTLGYRLQRAKRTSRWIVSPLPRFGVLRNWPRGIIPIGNAAAALEPIGGEGMGLALRSAELAAEALGRWQEDHDSSQITRLPREFRRLWKTRSLAYKWIARGLSENELADALTSIISAPAVQFMLKWLGN